MPLHSQKCVNERYVTTVSWLPMGKHLLATKFFFDLSRFSRARVSTMLTFSTAKFIWFNIQDTLNYVRLISNLRLTFLAAIWTSKGIYYFHFINYDGSVTLRWQNASSKILYLNSYFEQNIFKFPKAVDDLPTSTRYCNALLEWSCFKSSVSGNLNLQKFVV